MIEYALLIANNITLRTINTNNVADYVLNMDVPFSHQYRIMLAIIFSVLYNNKIDNHLFNASKQILHKNDYNNSRVIGYMMKLCYEIDGPFFRVLSFGLEYQENFWKLIIKKSVPKSIFSVACNHLKTLVNIRNSSHVDSLL